MNSPDSKIPAVRLQVGGSIREDALYVERRADAVLLDSLRNGEICYVLAPRQMGKSSLCSRAVRRLREEGRVCCLVDLNVLGGQKSTGGLDAWFLALVKEVSRLLGFPRGFIDEFWRSDDRTAGAYKWSQFLQVELPARIQQPVVLLFDEVDTTLSLPFGCDDFFATIRACYNSRSEVADLRRLTFAFVGVAAAGDLVSDPARTPFNLGTNVPLEDFSESEAQGFSPSLQGVVSEPGSWVQAIYNWTHGHPYMTHKLCAELRKSRPPAGDPSVYVEELVRRLFLIEGRHKDLNLQYCEKRLESRPEASTLLRIYRRLLEQETVFADRNDALQNELRLCGLCAWNDRVLSVRNPIFATVFDWNWVRSKEASRLIDEELEHWLKSGKPQTSVLRGQQLEAAKAWAQGRNDLTAEEQEFLLTSMEAARSDARRRALWVVTGSLVLALVLTMSFFISQLRDLRRRNEYEKQLLENATRIQALLQEREQQLRRQLDEESKLRQESEKREQAERLVAAQSKRETAELRRLLSGLDACTERSRAAVANWKKQGDTRIEAWSKRQDQLEKTLGFGQPRSPAAPGPAPK